MLAYPDTNILDACRTLFGTDACASPDFLLRLKHSDIKSAFRKRAKETHPDLFTAHDPEIQRKHTDKFRIVNDAYDIIRKYCEHRDRSKTGHRKSPRVRRTPAAAATPSFHVDNTGWRFRGVLPERRLEIGRYLYYRGCIPYRTLIKALAWQMRQRPVVGSIAKQWGWLNDNTIRAILAFNGRPHRLFTERAQQLGFLTSYQARLLLAYQRTMQKKLGRYFVEHGHLTHEEMESLAADLRRHNARFPLTSKQ
ncbi:MAG: J domain-containing protein [Nitrospirota bacterium]|nr:J domain-containing protein [Nitrospirota bacterium]